MLLPLNFTAMFTGIIETTGIIQKVSVQGTNKTLLISSPIAGELRIDQSLSHNGVCLTVESIEAGLHQVTAIQETMDKTNIGDWKTGDIINLERCLALSGRLDGHFVQGHIDTTGIITDKKDLEGSWVFAVRFPASFTPLIIEKGSIAVNGISLTCFDVQKDSFNVAIIPYTYTHTNLQLAQKGNLVNLEFDLLGKYIFKQQNLR